MKNSQVRADWKQAFQEMVLSGDDAPLLDETLVNVFDLDEWTW